jgi:signal transduction histidine kinase
MVDGAPDARDDFGSSDFAPFSTQGDRESEAQLKAVPVSRRRLVGPVFLILLVSFMSILGFLWLASRNLNEDSLARDRLVVVNLLMAERSQLIAMAQRHSAGDDLYQAFVEGSGVDGPGGPLGDAALLRLSSVLDGLDGLWVLAADGRVISAVLAGELETAPSTILHQEDLDLLVEEARTQDDRTAAAFLRRDAVVQLGAMAPIRPRGVDQTEMTDPAAYLLLLSDLTGSFFDRTPFRIGIRGLGATLDPASDGSARLELMNLADEVVGYLTWVHRRPGDQLLWPLSPAFALGLIAIGYFLFLFVRRADLFMERQAYLAAALQQEQSLRNLKTRFVSMVSHELRTPLAVIRSATELLERYGERMSKTDQAEELATIHRAVDALSRLVDNVVIMGKSEWLTKPSPSVEVDIADLCRQIWDESIRGFGASHRLTIEEEGQRRTMLADVAYLRALLSNLLQNAVKYSPGHDEVLVTLGYRPREISIKVTDYGIGVPADEAEAIFEPFRRAHNAESISGSGLGLAIARAAAKAMRASIKVTSKKGEGSTFEVLFPKA